MSKFSAGDEVFVRFVVKRVHEGDLPPSVELETIRANPGTDGMKSGVTLCEDLVENSHKMPHLIEWKPGKKGKPGDLVISERVFVSFIVLVCLVSIPWFDFFRAVFK